MSLTTGNNSIDSLVYDSWNANAGVAVTLTYSFMTTVPDNADATDANGFAAMTTAQKAGVVKALAVWSAVANITFVAVASGGDVQFGTNDQGTDSSGYAYLPYYGEPTYVFTNNQDSYNFSFADGGFGLSVLIHEIGHTLGLKHPGDYDATGSSVDGPFLPTATDNTDYTQMSYYDSTGFALHHKYGITAMLYDIQAIQYLYGANMSYHTGADTYSFVKASAMQCIWDAGGIDTFDFSGCTSATTINLNAGTFSSTAPGYNNISIAYNVTIERAIAGAGGSTIYANDAGNTIIGGVGTDVIYEGAGSDTITGGGGSDTVVFTKTLAEYTLAGSASALTVTGDGTDTLNAIATLKFSDLSVTLANYALHLGTSGNDAWTATTGNELFAGGDGLDVLTLSGALSRYQVAASGSAVTVTDLSGNGGTDLLTGVDRIVTGDGALALDVDGAAGQLYRLYEAMFNRAPDAAGMGYWLDYLDDGGAVVAIANGFVSSNEFTSIYGSNASNTTFVTALYANVLHRAPDTAGLAYWLGVIEQQGVTRAEALVGFSESPENIAAVAEVIPVSIAYTPWVA